MGVLGPKALPLGRKLRSFGAGMGVSVHGIGGFGGSRRGWGGLDLSAWLLGGGGYGSVDFLWRF
jgi:hypothetical protein